MTTAGRSLIVQAVLNVVEPITSQLKPAAALGAARQTTLTLELETYLSQLAKYIFFDNSGKLVIKKLKVRPKYCCGHAAPAVAAVVAAHLLLRLLPIARRCLFWCAWQVMRQGGSWM